MSAAPFLLIDAGNSRIKWALVDADGATLESGAFGHTGASLETASAAASSSGNSAAHGAAGELAASTHRSSSASAPVAASGTGDATPWVHLADHPQPRGAWISNVAGDAVAARIDRLLDRRWPGLPRTTIRAQAAQCGVTNRYTTPSQLGSDRWAGLIGAHAAFPGEHLLIATFGTATTLEALRADGTFEGGLIAPGWTLMMRSLGEHTAQLPTLDAGAARGLLGGHGEAAAISSVAETTAATTARTATASTASSGDDPHAHASPRRRSLFAIDTPRSLSAGSALAQAGLIERAWADLQDDWRVPVRLIVSGGAADEMTRVLKVPHTRHDSLVLSGLALIATGVTEPGTA